MSELPHKASVSFEGLVRLHETHVLRIAYRMLGNWPDAEDVAQDTFVKLHHHGLLAFADDAAVLAWLYRVAVNLCLDRLRRTARRPVVELRDLASAERSAEAGVLRDERKRLLEAALASLPERERAAIVLREIEGLSTAETAAALGSAEVTVRSQISKALGRLRTILTAKEAI